MPKFRSKFQTSLALLLLTLLLNSCDRGCVEAYEFDSEHRSVDSNPIKDGIIGYKYSNSSGGQKALWHETGIVTDGSQVVVEFRGSWTAWSGGGMNDKILNGLPECKICAKKRGVDNCICAPKEISKPELDSFGNSLDVDCSKPDNQANPESCSCTNSSGTISDYGTYYIATNYQNKDESLKYADKQEICRYTKGIGMYVGLFGKDGNVMPKRVYQMYPSQEICDISRNSQGKCLDARGNDFTKFVYKSPNGKSFIKDDMAGNNGSDTDPSDDEYHKAGEYMKFIIDDQWYSDNYGGYDMNFAGGFVRKDDNKGMLEYIVGTVEDSLLGKVIDSGSKREGGALKFMYNSIVKDSVFIVILRTCLTIYIVLFGIAVLSGTLQISKKEMTTRIVQLCLIIFFTTETSWYFYNQLVVGFFKDGMDAIIGIFMTASDNSVDTSSLIINSQLDRAQSASQATRFSYADVIIRKLFSSGTSKKIWSLVFSDILGIVYVAIIYALIFAFLYIMVTAALVYIQILLGLIFVLCLGPIFMITLLFGTTKPIFKRWISYMSAQSFQIICLFLVVYLFIILIDKDFTELLYYKACTITMNFGLFNINFLISEEKRGSIEWFTMFIKIGAMLFLLKMIMDKIPGFAGQLVTVNSQQADVTPTYNADTNTSALGLAGSLLGHAKDAITSVGGSVKEYGGIAATYAADSTGVSGAYRAVRSAAYSAAESTLLTKIPFVGSYLTRREDQIIQEQKEAFGTGAGKDKDIREAAMKAARAEGINDQEMLKRLDQKLVIEPLREVITKSIADLKNQNENAPIGREEMKKAVTAKVEEWAKVNSSIDSSKFTALLDEKGGEFRSLIKYEGVFSSSEAAQAFAGNEKAKYKYLQHLIKEEKRQDDKMSKRTGLNWGWKKFQGGFRALGRKAVYNPKIVRENFLHKVKFEEKEKVRKSEGLIDDLTSGVSKFHNQGIFGRNRADMEMEAEKIKKEMKIIDNLNTINKNYDEKITTESNKEGVESQAEFLGKLKGIEEKRNGELKQADPKENSDVDDIGKNPEDHKDLLKHLEDKKELALKKGLKKLEKTQLQLELSQLDDAPENAAKKKELEEQIKNAQSDLDAIAIKEE